MNNFSIEERVKDLELEVLLLKQQLSELLKDKADTDNVNNADILNLNEAMTLLKMPRHILYTKLSNREIPGFKVGKLYKFKRGDLLEWQKAEEQGNHINVEKYVEQYMQTHKLKG